MKRTSESGDRGQETGDRKQAPENLSPDTCNLSPVTCPLTHGQPTRMTERGFVAACAARREQPDNEYEASACKKCGGKRRPKELEIIALAAFGQVATSEQTKQEVSVMATKQGVCDGCGKDKQVAMCSGEKLCSVCASIAGTIAKKPETIIRMVLRHGNPKAFFDLMVSIMGVDLMMDCVSPYLATQEQADAGADSYRQIFAEFKKMVVETIGAGGGETPDQLREMLQEMARERNECQAAVYRLNDVLAEKERTIASLRDECQAPGVLTATAASALESHLLDLALDAMRGVITGLDPDRIAMLREAA